jgi:hypothetical protein
MPDSFVVASNQVDVRYHFEPWFLPGSPTPDPGFEAFVTVQLDMQPLLYEKLKLVNLEQKNDVALGFRGVKRGRHTLKVGLWDELGPDHRIGYFQSCFDIPSTVRREEFVRDASESEIGRGSRL